MFIEETNSTYYAEAALANGRTVHPAALTAGVDDRQPGSRNSLRWYVAETLPRAELLGQQHLQRQNFRCFCPRFRATRRHARRTRTVLAPLFPGYIFIQFSLEHDRWQAINGTVGIKRLVGSGRGIPQPMPLEAMAALLARCEEGEVRHLLPDLKPGEEIRLTAGPFANQIAAIESLDNKGRVRILLDILGGYTPVEVDLRDIGPV